MQLLQSDDVARQQKVIASHQINASDSLTPKVQRTDSAGTEHITAVKRVSLVSLTVQRQEEEIAPKTTRFFQMRNAVRGRERAKKR